MPKMYFLELQVWDDTTVPKEQTIQVLISAATDTEAEEKASIILQREIDKARARFDPHSFPRNPMLVTKQNIGASRTKILSMTFRDFIIYKLKDDRRIKGIPFFHGVVGKGSRDPGYTRWPVSLEMYQTLGDVPMSALVQVPEMEFLRIRNVSSKAMRALKNILADYQLSLKEL